MAHYSGLRVFPGYRSAARRASRKRTLRPAVMAFHGGKSLVECVVLDLSDTGARLQPLDTVSPPDEFVLELSDGRAFLCEMVWREASLIGVAFKDDITQRYLI